ncbi:MAG: DNA polymerase ligase N-terminal domain-containing protein [Patescibacteria group bacterium]|jgi:DNA ligase D-like protein (predicted 3'-phosphoesterase)
MLEEYKNKRKFNQTPEPSGKIDDKNSNRFVIQEHHATNLHWDFRLELDGILKSWAVPKNLPEKIGEKHLAVETEDHPVEYINFEGEIPEGNYGAGTVKIWDAGNYDMLEQKKDSLKFILHGKKLKSEYHMFKPNFKDSKGTEWLVIKSDNSKKTIDKVGKKL